MKLNWLYLASAMVGVACGVISNHSLLAGSWANLLFWAAAGIILGWFAVGRKQILSAGVLYGLFLTLTFLLSGFRGTSDKLAGFLVLTAGLVGVGAVCGLACVFIGSWLRQRLRP